jgi:hypothetical protein
MNHGRCEDFVTPCFLAVDEETVSELGLVGSGWRADTESTELRVTVGHVPVKSQLLLESLSGLMVLT